MSNIKPLQVFEAIGITHTYEDNRAAFIAAPTLPNALRLTGSVRDMERFNERLCYNVFTIGEYRRNTHVREAIRMEAEALARLARAEPAI